MMCIKLIVFYFIFAATNRGWADDGYTKYEDCANLFRPPTSENFCCKSMETMKEMLLESETLVECMPKDGKDLTCQYLTCAMDKRGFIEKDKDSDEVINALVDKYTPDSNPDTKKMGDRIRAKCLKGKYKKYPTTDCRAIQIPACIYLNAVMACDSWKDKDVCKKLAASAAQCKASIDQEEGDQK